MGITHLGTCSGWTTPRRGGRPTAASMSLPLLFPCAYAGVNLKGKLVVVVKLQCQDSAAAPTAKEGGGGGGVDGSEEEDLYTERESWQHGGGRNGRTDGVKGIGNL